jgi:pimeloyl-[acyl-carrier protein] synthase
MNDWILTRWADCQAVLRDPRFSSNGVHSALPPQTTQDVMREANQATLLFLDPPDHTRLRALVSQAFTPRRVEGLRPLVATLVDHLLETAAKGGGQKGGATEQGTTMDVMAALAQPLPVLVICELLGVPVEDHHLFGPWSSGASRLLDGDLDEATLMSSLTAAAQLLTYFSALCERRRAEPTDDLLTALVQAEAAGDRLTEPELMATLVLLLVAGHETTTNLIGNGALALLKNPDQADWLREKDEAGDTAAVKNAIEELLRYDPPVQITGRYATSNLEINGLAVAKGEGVAIMLAAANRDPEHFPEPDRLDLSRADPHNLAFSQGIHYCLGAALARLEGEVVLPRLFRRFPTLRLPSATPQYRDHRVLRGLAALPAVW